MKVLAQFLPNLVCMTLRTRAFRVGCVYNRLNLNIFHVCINITNLGSSTRPILYLIRSCTWYLNSSRTHPYWWIFCAYCTHYNELSLQFPEVGSFELMVESVQGLKDLVDKFSDQPPSGYKKVKSRVCTVYLLPRNLASNFNKLVY